MEPMDAGRARAIHPALMSAVRTGDETRIATVLDVHTMDSAAAVAFLIPGPSTAG